MERLASLARRIDASLASSQAWIDRPPELRASGTSAPSSGAAEVQALAQARDHAEASARLQAQRCAALEDRIAELEAALAGASSARARAEALAEDAKRDASEALDALDAQREAASNVSTPGSAPSPGPTELSAGGIGEAFQAKLLEIERLTRERDALRRSSDEWRTRARKRQRERDEFSEKSERAQAQLNELRERDEGNRKRLGELERVVAEQRRELELAERRTEHLRRHLNTAPR